MHREVRLARAPSVPDLTAPILASIGSESPPHTAHERALRATLAIVAGVMIVAALPALVLGDDLQGEAPYAQALLVKGARHRGLHMTIAHPRRVKLTRARFGGDWLAYRPGGERALLTGGGLAAAVDRDDLRRDADP